LANCILRLHSPSSFITFIGKEFQELAHKKLLAIQQAYETLMKGR